jgi:hypothetical protein
MGRKGEVPCDAVYATKNETEDGEDDHAGASVAFGAWCVERRNVSSTRRNGVGCNDLKGGSKGEGGNEEHDEEWADDDDGEGEKKERGWHEEEPINEEGMLVRNVSQLHIPVNEISAKGMCKFVAPFSKGKQNSGSHRFIVPSPFDLLRFDKPEKKQGAEREKQKHRVR